MNRELAETVIATFRDEPIDSLYARFACFDERDWRRTKEWLDTSGLSLYFLARTKSLRINNAIPAKVQSVLEGNYANNRDHTQDMFDEFVKLNMEFQRSRLTYANLKGFTLAPRSYPDPTCRYLHDLDFLMSSRDADDCLQVLQRHGYQLTAACGDTWEFTPRVAEITSWRDLYETGSRRGVEIHFVSEHDGRLSRLQLQEWNGFEFPALSEWDKFLAQAGDLFEHFQTEWTRTAWLLEFAACIRSRQGDDAFWQEVIAAIKASPEMKVAVGVATLIASRTFGVTAPAELTACTVGELPARVVLWVDRYQDELVYVESPGSKLYLLLQDVLYENQPDRKARRPIPSPKRISVGERGDLWLRVRLMLARVWHLWVRLRFHATEGLRYKLEAARWKKFVVDSRS